MDDYTYIPEPDKSNQDNYNNNDNYNNERGNNHSTSLQELDQIEQQYNNQEDDLYNQEQLDMRNSQYNYITSQQDPAGEPEYNTVAYTQTKRDDSRNVKERLEEKQFSMKIFLKKVANSYMDIINDILNGSVNMETFTKESRLIAIAILLILTSLFFVFFQTIE
jgi:hypothetical protein